MWQKMISLLLDWLWPRTCLGCGIADTALCQNCFNNIPFFKNKPYTLPAQDNLDKIIIATNYKNSLIQEIIEAFKFRFVMELGAPLANLLSKTWQALGAPNDNYLVIPIPLHKKRLLERGFNQSEIIGKFFAEKFAFQFETELLWRKKNTIHQVGLSKSKRLMNIKNAFEVNQTIAKKFATKKMTVILIDDVVTTGATANTASATLKLAGFKNVWLIAVAHE